MTSELKVIIDKETGAFRKYTVVDEVRSAFLDVFEVVLILTALKEHEEDLDKKVVLSKLTEDQDEQDFIIENAIKEFGTFEEAKENIDITNDELHTLLTMYARWKQDK